MMARKKYHSVGTLSGLPGVKDGTPGWTGSSISELLAILGNKGVATAAGDRGALNIWCQGVRKGYSVEFMRHCVTLSRLDGIRKPAVAAWLKEWHPKLAREASR